MKKLLLPLLLLLAFYGTAQEGFLMLKNKDRTFKTYLTGSYFQATHQNGAALNGHIVKISKDSFYLRNFFIQKTGNEKGFVFFDTIFYGITPLHLSDVRSVYVPKKNFAYKSSEYTAYLAAAVFSIMSLVNGSKFDQKGTEVLKEVGIRGGGLFLLGRIFRWLGREDYKLGRKYRLATII